MFSIKKMLGISNMETITVSREMQDFIARSQPARCMAASPTLYEIKYACSCELPCNLKSRGFRATSLSTYDFSTL